MVKNKKWAKQTRMKTTQSTSSAHCVIQTYPVEIISMFLSTRFQYGSVATAKFDESPYIIYELPFHLTESPNLNEIIKNQFKRCLEGKKNDEKYFFFCILLTFNL